MATDTGADMKIHQLVERLKLPSPALRRALRENAGLSQTLLAEQLGVSRAAVSRWETGDRTPREDNRIAYADALRELREMVG